MRWFLGIITIGLVGCAYPHVSDAELNRRVAKIDRLVEYCQNRASVGHPTIAVEDERFTQCVKEQNEKAY
jgi:hypothetical protein